MSQIPTVKEFKQQSDVLTELFFRQVSKHLRQMFGQQELIAIFHGKVHMPTFFFFFFFSKIPAHFSPLLETFR